MDDPAPAHARRGSAAAPLTQRTLRLVGIFLAGIAAFVALLTAVYLLPEAPIARNLGPSLALLREEGLYPQTFFDGPGFRRDNYTEAIMLDTSIKNPGQNAFQAAMSGPKNGAPESGSPVDALAETLEGKRPQAEDYAYYWNGYQVFLRPALVAASYPVIRVYNHLLLSALALWATVLLGKAAGREAGVAFVLAFALTGFIAVPGSLHYSSMTYLALAGVVAALLALRQGFAASVDLELFFVLGMLAAFLDLLSTPLLSLLLPLVAMLIVRTRAARLPVRQHAWFVVVSSTMWSVGYLGSWLTKTLLSSLVLERNVMAEAARQVLFRVGLGEGQPRVAEALVTNVRNLFPGMSGEGLGPTSLSPIGAAATVVLAGLLVTAFVYRRPGREISQAGAVLLVVPIPYLWFVVANNHSSIHNFFTYRIQAGAVFALLYFLLVLPDYDRILRGLLPAASINSPPGDP
ncbi:MAG: hypothetical protein KJ067_24485 [Vicinamibacteria bacterium]|nr:hypothetical protein [Vicinamibacteria bacterium]